MRIIDSPGVVFDEDSYDDGKGSKMGSVLLRNVFKVEDVEDPIAVGEYTMLNRCFIFSHLYACSGGNNG
jgi:nuclear GTP-binding protein